MRETPYYSVRTGKQPAGGRVDWASLTEQFLSVFEQLRSERYFDQALGYECVDDGFVPGSEGSDPEAFFFRRLKKRNLWPIPEHIKKYSEDDLFDVIELLHDCVSKGVQGRNHSFNGCGWHYKSFNRRAGQKKFCEAINDILSEYGPGYLLSKQGKIRPLAPRGLADLEGAPAPPGDRENVQARVESAISKFNRRGAKPEDRKDAVRDLADVLEFLRPQAKGVLASKDEADLFNLANNFGIRHHNGKQQTNYDKAIWYSWMFYYYLATIHAMNGLIQKAEQDT